MYTLCTQFVLQWKKYSTAETTSYLYIPFLPSGTKVSVCGRWPNDFKCVCYHVATVSYSKIIILHYVYKAKPSGLKQIHFVAEYMAV